MREYDELKKAKAEFFDNIHRLKVYIKQSLQIPAIKQIQKMIKDSVASFQKQKIAILKSAEVKDNQTN